MRTSTPILAALAIVCVIPIARADPQITSWLTAYSTKYARIYQTDAAKNTGTSVSTWTSQTSPAYCGIQEIAYSANWIYLRTTGLGAHVMGPWYLNAAHTQAFPNLPANQHVLYRIPRTPTAPTTKTLTGLGAIGYFVDGIAMFDSRDAFYWNGTTEVSGNGTGYWNREAYVNESVTFDPGYAHQEQTGNHHYHANPIALRYLLGDHVDYNPATKTYAESAASVTKHSPILGWVRDGYPIYGSYGFATAMDATSGVRRMVSGYQLRNGQNGSDVLTTRTTIPLWAQRLYNVGASQSGPTVSTTYPLGRFMEDNAYLGDLGKVQGTDFDLDSYNGRFCVTPKFPNGTYAYFVSISANGAPSYPYNIGRAFYGSPTGSAQTSIAETVTTVFQGGPARQETMQNPTINPATGDVTIVWNATEAGTYIVEANSNLGAAPWTQLNGNVTATGQTGQKIETAIALTNSNRFYRVTRTTLATYDPVTGTTMGGGGSSGIVSVSPTSAARGAMLTLTVNLDAAATPAPPPQTAPVNSVTIGTIASANRVHVTQTQVTASFTIPANAATGAQTVTVIFPGLPENPTQTVTYTLAGGFTVTASSTTTLPELSAGRKAWKRGRLRKLDEQL